MGEIADEHYNAIVDSEWGFYRCGRRTSDGTVHCTRCGETGLFWEQRGERWHLFKMRGLILSPHTCNSEKLAKQHARAFDNLDG